jgi:hypothetical protein
MKQNATNFLILLSAAVIMPLSFASAAVFERDWNTPGDGLLTYDDVNQREWLDVTETELFLFPVPGDGLQTEARYQQVVAELSPGGMFEGFTVAKRADIIAFAQSGGINTATFDFEANQAAVRNVINLLGVSFGNLDGRAASMGFIDELPSPPPASCALPCRISAMFELIPPTSPPDFAGVYFSASDDRVTRSLAPGVMLYRAVVPEPSTLMFVAVLVGCAVSFRSRRHKRHVN